MPLPAFLSALLGGGGGAAAGGAAGGAGGGMSSGMLMNMLGGMKSKSGGSGGGGGGGNILKYLGKPLATPLGAMTLGAINLFEARKARNEAEGLMPSLYDPNQLALLSEIEQKRRSINTGSAFAADINELQSGTAQAMGAISRVTGGDVAGTVNALLAAQQAGARGVNQALAKSDQMGLQYDSLYSNMAKRVSDRAMQLQLAERTQKLAEWAQAKQDGMANLGAGIAKSGGSSINWGDIFTRNQVAKGAAPASGDKGAAPASGDMGAAPASGDMGGAPGGDMGGAPGGDMGGAPGGDVPKLAISPKLQE
jgi:hypothetical protein